MKNIITLLLTILILFSVTLTAIAHSGRTDYKGGHLNHLTGEYHYHHGYPEHQHINGECPYEFNNSTNHKSESSFSSSQNISNLNSKNKTFGEYSSDVFTHYAVLIFISCFCFGLMLAKFYELNLFRKFLLLKVFGGTAIVSIVTVIFADAFEEPALNYIVPIIGLPILLFISYLPVRKSKYKKFHNNDFFRVYGLVDKKRIHEEKFFNDWRKVAKEDLGIYYCYTCYVSKTSNTIHYKKGCSNANAPSHLLKTNGNVCQKCGKIKREVSLDRKIYNKFIDVCDVLNFWGIKPL